MRLAGIGPGTLQNRNGSKIKQWILFGIGIALLFFFTNSKNNLRQRLHDGDAWVTIDDLSLGKGKEDELTAIEIELEKPELAENELEKQQEAEMLDDELAAAIWKPKPEELDAIYNNSKYSEVLKKCKSRRPERPGERGNHPQVIYIHIPKAGGTSIQHGLASWCRKRGIRYLKFDGPSIRGTSTACPGGAMDAGVLAGHRGFGYCTQVKKQEENKKRRPLYFTAIREPISRMVSYFDYNKKTRATPEYIAAFGRSKTLNQLVKQFNSTTALEKGERILRYSGSQQARFMCGFECLGPAAASPHLVSPEVMLSRAKANLLRTDVVGVLENLNAVITQLRLHVSWIPKQKTWPHANEVKVAKSELNEFSREIFKQWSYVDNELYKLAVRIEKQKTKHAEDCLEEFRKERLAKGHDDDDDDEETQADHEEENNDKEKEESKESDQATFEEEEEEEEEGDQNEEEESV